MKNEEEDKSKAPRRLARKNLCLIAIGLLVVVIGFILVAVGPVSGLHNYEPDIFSARRIAVGPMIVFAGYLFIMFGIWYKPKK